MTYYRIVDNAVGNYSQGQVVDGELLGEVDRLEELGAIAPVDDADVPDDAISVPEEAPPAEGEGEAAPAEEGAAAEPAAEEAAPAEPAPADDSPNPFPSAN